MKGTIHHGQFPSSIDMNIEPKLNLVDTQSTLKAWNDIITKLNI